MKIAYIHSNKKIWTGSHYINDLIVCKLREHKVNVQSFYPHFQLTDTPIQFRGLNNILFFYSLLEKRDKILKCDIIQGTTYTPLAFMRFSIPVVSHFGSTTMGFLKWVPKTKHIEPCCADILYLLKKDKVIYETDLKTLRPLNDIVTIEQYAAEKADYIIATSEIVKRDLIASDIPASKIEVIHNAIEDYWFETRQSRQTETSLVFLGRMGDDVFTMKIKGVDRLIHLLQQFPNTPKLSIVMTRNKHLVDWLRDKIPLHQVEANILKEKIPQRLAGSCGSILLLTSRYEWFSLSLIEWMSQWMVPVSFSVGIAPEVIKNGENGFLVETLEEAEEKIRYLLSHPKELWEMAEWAKQTSQSFKSEILAKKMIDIYKKILKQ